MSMAAFLASLWKNSHLVELLEERESFTLDLLDEEDIIEELKTENAKLIELICDPQALQQILSIAINGLPETEDEKRRTRYPFVCCEILSLGNEKILSKFTNTPELMDLLFNTLSKDPPLDPIIASRFARIASALLHKEKAATFAYLQQRGNTVVQLATHIQSPSIIELVLSMIEHENADISPVGIVQWLHRERFISMLLDRLSSASGSEYVAQLLVDLVRVSTTHPSELVRELQSQESVEKLLAYTLSTANATQLIVGLDVLIELLVHNNGQHAASGKGGDDEAAGRRGSTEYSACLQCVLARAKEFYDILATPGSTSTAPGRTPQFGFRRLKVLELFVTLLHTEAEAMYATFRELGVVAACLDIFFGHPWNNFIHHQVLDMVLSILHGPNEEFRMALFAGNNRLADRIVAAFREDAEGQRKGFLGHLVKIANEVTALAAKHPLLQQQLDAHEEWSVFVKAHLSAINDLEGRVWGADYESELSKHLAGFSLAPNAGHPTADSGPHAGEDDAARLHTLDEDEDIDEEDFLQRDVANAAGPPAALVSPTTAHLFGDVAFHKPEMEEEEEEEEEEDDEEEDDEEDDEDDDSVQVKPTAQLSEDTVMEELPLSPAPTAAEPARASTDPPVEPEPSLSEQQHPAAQPTTEHQPEPVQTVS